MAYSCRWAPDSGVTYIARKLGVSHTYIQKLRGEFAANPTAMLEKASRLVRLPGGAMVSANGRMLLPEYRQYTTFEELAQAQRQTLKMAGQGLLRGLYPELSGAKRIYISPDGALNEIPLGILQSADGRRAIEKYDIRTVLSTRDLLRPSHGAATDTAILIGNPRFLLSDEAQRKEMNRLRGPDNQGQSITIAAVPPSDVAGDVLSRDARERGPCSQPPPPDGILCPLPGTATEVQAIGELLRGKNWLVSTYQGEQTLEEVVTSAVHPRLLHVATHGFFLSDQDGRRGESLTAQTLGFEDPMLRSGLFFAGADRTLKSQPPIEGVESGVLTAYEATTLNLLGTELVVLSACETGLGEVKNGEGVFGLRRGLQESGADSVLMSLWSVPDRETQELMTTFYENWLNGMEKPEALRLAQIKERDVVKRRYGRDLPYAW
jgi:CHAT domain-containing protein